MMKIELYESNISLYVCIVNYKGECEAIRLFDRESGDARDQSGPPYEGSRTTNVEALAHWLSEEPDCWQDWKGGMGVPSLVYKREIPAVSELAAHYDGSRFHIDKPLGALSNAASTFINAFTAQVDDMDGCDRCRVSGLLEG